MSTKKYPVGNEERFNEFLVHEYLKHGSVDEVMRKNRYDLPISYAQFQRVLDKWGIVKAAGPNNKLSEILSFMMRMTEESATVEKLYKKMPPSFQTSATTMYRILTYIKEGITRRLATGLVVTPSTNKNRILVGTDVSTPRLKYGKPYGSISIPMGFSRNRDSRREAILRVLQQEVFSNLAIKRRLPEKIIPKFPRPFMFLDIADIRIEIYHLSLPKRWVGTSKYSSFKLERHRYLSVSELSKIKPSAKNIRAGIREIIAGYNKYQALKKRNLYVHPIFEKSYVNAELAKIK